MLAGVFTEDRAQGLFGIAAGKRVLGLVKVVRDGFGACDRQRFYALSLHRDHIFLILECAFDQQKRVLDDHRMIPLE